jgi:hypothetical protein
VTPYSAAVAEINSLAGMDDGTASTEDRIAIVQWPIDPQSTT